MKRDHSWLHFYQMDALGKTACIPTVLKEGHGVHVFDETGRKFLDAISGAYCVNVGYGRDEICDAARAAARKIHFVSPFTALNPPAAELASKLSRLVSPILGPDARVFFTNSGSEAIETALKIARACASRRGKKGKWIISRDKSYHGMTAGALSITGHRSLHTEFMPLLPEIAYAPSMRCTDCVEATDKSECARQGAQCAGAIRSAVPEAGAEVAAIIVEPHETSNGMTAPPLNYFEEVAAAKKDLDALLIIDEVITGFGRLGAWFGSGLYNIDADILVCAKGLTSGYESLAATIVKKEVADSFSGGDDDMFFHGATFGGRPAAAAAALENLRIMEEEGLVENARRVGKNLFGDLQARLGDHPAVSAIEGAGLLYGIHLTAPGKPDEPVGRDDIIRIRNDLFRRGIITSLYYTRHEPVIELAPPLCITDDEAAFLGDQVIASLGLLA